MEKTLTNDRVSCKYKVIYGELVLDELWLSKDCDSLESMSIVAGTIEREAKNIFKESTCKRSEKKPEEQLAQTTATVNKVFAEPSGFPRCPLCSSPMKLSKKQDYWNCVMSKLENVDGKWTNKGCRGNIKV
jgi:uncharacterized protein with PIN domain